MQLMLLKRKILAMLNARCKKYKTYKLCTIVNEHCKRKHKQYAFRKYYQILIMLTNESIRLLKFCDKTI